MKKAIREGKDRTNVNDSEGQRESFSEKEKKNENGVNIISRKKEGELLLLRCYTIGLEDEGKGGEGKKRDVGYYIYRGKLHITMTYFDAMGASRNREKERQGGWRKFSD